LISAAKLDANWLLSSTAQEDADYSGQASASGFAFLHGLAQYPGARRAPPAEAFLHAFPIDVVECRERCADRERVCGTEAERTVGRLRR
jgi:hypothetical protein